MQGPDDHPVGPGSDADETEVDGGTKHNVFVEHYELQPIDPQTNGPQLLYGLRYHVHIVKPGEVETFHDQVGYWLWEAGHAHRHAHARDPARAGAAGLRPRRARRHRVRGHGRGSARETYGILSSPFLDTAFRTLSFRIRVTVHADGTWSYEEDTVMKLPDRDEPFHHIDRNTLDAGRTADAEPARTRMTIDVRRADTRAHTEIDWLDSRHSFSFGPHYDPTNTHHGLLLVSNDDRVRAGTGFGTHAHQDMEIVTWVSRAGSSTTTPRAITASSIPGSRSA